MHSLPEGRHLQDLRVGLGEREGEREGGREGGRDGEKKGKNKR